MCVVNIIYSPNSIGLFYLFFCNRKELKGVKSSLNIRGIVLSFKIVCRFSTFLSLATYVYSGNVFTAHQVFIVTSYFNHLYLTMLHLWPISLTFTGEAYVSIRRIQSFLLLPEGKYQRKMNMNYKDEEEEEAQNLMGNGSKLTAGLGLYGAVNGQSDKKKKNLVFKELQMTNGVPRKRRTVNSDTVKKEIIFDNVTALWITDDNGQNIGSTILMFIQFHS